VKRGCPMQDAKKDSERDDRGGDGIDRRGFLKCMAWAGTGLVWTFSGGVPTSRVFGAQPGEAADNSAGGDFSFVQISDSHIGFKHEPNQDVVGTLRAAIARINALPKAPEFLIHTGDLTHLSKPDEFDTVAEVIKETRTG